MGDDGGGGPSGLILGSRNIMHKVPEDEITSSWHPGRNLAFYHKIHIIKGS